MREAAGFAFAAGIVALSLLATGTRAGTASALVAVAVGVAIPVGLRWLRTWQIARWLRYHADCHVTAAWDEAGYSTSGCQHKPPSRIAWKQISRAIETSCYVILQSRRMLFILPRAALDTEAIEDFGAHLDRQGIKRIPCDA